MEEGQIRAIFACLGAVIIGSHFVYTKKPDGWHHGPDYVDKAAVTKDPFALSLLCQELAGRFPGQGIKVVVAPTVGGIAIGQWVAHHLAPQPAKDGTVLSIYAEEDEILQRVVLYSGDLNARSRDDELAFESKGKVQLELIPGARCALTRVTYFRSLGTNRVLKRGYDLVARGRRCLVVEDIINSGATVTKTIRAVQEAQGEVVGVAALCNRSGGKVTAETLGVPRLESLLDLNMVMYPEDLCSICLDPEQGPGTVRIDLGHGREFLSRRGLPLD